jgi:hypothetical protein
VGQTPGSLQIRRRRGYKLVVRSLIPLRIIVLSFFNMEANDEVNNEADTGPEEEDLIAMRGSRNLVRLAENLADQFDREGLAPGGGQGFIQSTTVMHLSQLPAAAPADSRGNESDSPQPAGRRPGRRAKTMMFFGVRGTPGIRNLFYRTLASETEQAAEELSSRESSEITGSLRRSENYSRGTGERFTTSSAPFPLSRSQASSADPLFQDGKTIQSTTNQGAARIDISDSEGEDEAVEQLRGVAQSLRETAAGAALGHHTPKRSLLTLFRLKTCTEMWMCDRFTLATGLASLRICRTWILYCTSEADICTTCIMPTGGGSPTLVKVRSVEWRAVAR